MLNLLAAAGILLSLQDPVVSSPGQTPDWLGPIHVKDTKTGEIKLILSGQCPKYDHEKGSGILQQVRLDIYTKPNERQNQAHQITLFANNCEAEGVGMGDAGGQGGRFRFWGGLKGFLDRDVRIWASEGTFDASTMQLHCPQSTRLVHFTWPAKVDLASMLVFAGPPELEWLQLVGAPAPDFELVGEEFTYDANAHLFTAGRKGRLNVTGRPGDAFSPGGKPRRPASKDTTLLKSEGPLSLRNLGTIDGDGSQTLLVTADREVVLSHRSDGGTAKTRSDNATIYIALPPGGKAGLESRPLALTLKGHVQVEDTDGYSATADRVEWSHEDDLLRMTGAPLVEVRQASQRLQARRIVIDRWNRVINFHGDIAATLLADRLEPGSSETARTLTLTPAELRMDTDGAGRPIALRAWNGVRISGHLGAVGPQGIQAEGKEFEWDLISSEGLLRGSPLARIEQGGNLVVAPLISFRGRSFMVAKGPKLLRYFSVTKPALHAGASLLEASLGLPGLQGIPDRQRAYMDLAVSSDGDAVVDRASNKVILVDRCEVRTQDATLKCDRLFVLLKEGGEEFERVLGFGGVHAAMSRDLGESIVVSGETLELLNRQNPDRLELTVIGLPQVSGRLGTQDFNFGRLWVNLDTMKMSFDHAETRVKY